MQTITLELLRHGPSHNQLLSPLTSYLALCGNHAGVTIQIPFEHNQFLHRLRALGQEIAPEAAIFQLRDTAQVLGNILALVPGLTADISQSGTRDDPLHLRLIISASELALLPFELALSPAGYPSAGQTLLLQSRVPICLTRETHRVPDQSTPWPKKPRVLFAFAAPNGSQVPVEAHLLALRRAIDPWVRQLHPEGADGVQSNSLHTGQQAGVDEYLTVLPFASVNAIQEACASRCYTHVHILAHGVPFPDGYDTRFGLLLHGDRSTDPADVVSGERLATSLRAAQAPPATGLARPPIVSLTACNGGNVGTVAGAGASIAHALNSGGIPFVVTGQFPLSFEASVRMVEVLYEGLLWGVDPRIVLDSLRRRLFTDFPSTHDWASLTAYASFPIDLDEQLRDVQIERASAAINIALDLADAVTRDLPGENIDYRLLEAARRRIKRATDRLRGLLNSGNFDRRCSHICGLLASTSKREAEILFAGSGSQQDQRSAVVAALRHARDHYWQSFDQDRAQSWAIVQYLSLDLLLTMTAGGNTGAKSTVSPTELWHLAMILSQADLKGTDRERQLWALGNLIELALLAELLLRGQATGPTAGSREAQEWSKELVRLAGSDDFAVYSTRRQIQRYLGWYSRLAPAFVTSSMRELAQVVVGTLSPV
jgi:hypothetical protein